LDRQAIGRAAEDAAAAHLQAAGLDILLRNYRCRLGELDLIARDADVLVIAEVRLRSREDFGGGAASVDAGKQRRIVGASRHLLMRRPALARLPARFDVIEVRPGAPLRIRWIRSAFSL
jgi:putative endonuclease